MSDRLVVGGLPEDEFRREIEDLLRRDEADAAADRLRSLLSAVCGPGRPLPARFLTASPKSIEFPGWFKLPARIAEYDNKVSKISAIGIDLSSPGHIGQKPSDGGFLDPVIETNFYSDDIWPFSTSDRVGLLAGYSQYSCAWQGGFKEIDDTVQINGIADLYGAVYLLKEAAETESQTARVLGACFIVVLIYLALRDFAPRDVLPHPLAVILGSNEDYPYFSAPVFAARPDIGPQAQPHIGKTEHKSKSLNATDEILAERAAERRSDLQRTFEVDFAKYREIHRMLYYFPFYRFRGRSKLAQLWESHLAMTCNIHGINPGQKISWRMSAGKLTELLRRIAEAKNVPDVEQALNPVHTDRLHTKWLTLEKAANFKLPAGTSLFQLQLAAALQSGGPWVIDRWERAKPYCVVQ
jgi:hypothetical protein